MLNFQSVIIIDFLFFLSFFLFFFGPFFFRSLDSVKHFSLISEHGKIVFGVGEFSNIQQLVDHFKNYPIIGGETGLTST